MDAFDSSVGRSSTPKSLARTFVPGGTGRLPLMPRIRAPDSPEMNRSGSCTTRDHLAQARLGRDGCLDRPVGQFVARHADDDLVCAEGLGHQGRPAEDEVRRADHEHLVFDAARLALGGVDDHDRRAVAGLGGLDHRPELAREGNAAPPWPRRSTCSAIEISSSTDSLGSGPKISRWASRSSRGIRSRPAVSRAAPILMIAGASRPSSSAHLHSSPPARPGMSRYPGSAGCVLRDRRGGSRGHGTGARPVRRVRARHWAGGSAWARRRHAARTRCRAADRTRAGPGAGPVPVRGTGPESPPCIGPGPRRGIGPESARGIGPVPTRGIGPESARGIGPVPSLGMGPVSTRGIGPVSARGIGPVPGAGHRTRRRTRPGRGIGPGSARGIGPEPSRGIGPESARGIGPVASRGIGPVSTRGIGPDSRPRHGPVSTRGIGPVSARGIGPVSARGIGPVPRRGMGPVSTRGVSAAGTRRRAEGSGLRPGHRAQLRLGAAYGYERQIVLGHVFPRCSHKARRAVILRLMPGLPAGLPGPGGPAVRAAYR